ncbi:MAG: prenyltransferase/squalene oxidase repeat-containing protein [Planctomycetota bacterium]|nr:prenyltransferase/squalene oxidase repeat-containing protein [Planctomycetota bacterium]
MKRKKSFEEEEFEEEIEEEEIEGDPEAPSDQPLSDNTIGALGVGAGSPTGAYGQRKGGRRGKRAGRKGGNELSERAVDLGLKWLADHQEADGHWDTKKWNGHGPYDPGIAGLALLAFAGAGHTEKTGKYRRVVRKAIQWLSEHQDNDGNFAPGQTMYSHAIPVLALLEEVAMAPVPRTKSIAKRGLDYMLKAQNQYKAWRYWPNDGDNDISVTTWCVMAMKAAKVAGFDVPAGSWAGVQAFLDEVTEPNYGQVGYTARPIRGASEQPFQKYSMTACGLLCRLYLGVSRDDRLVRLGVQILMENLPEWNQPGINAPFFYYGTTVPSPSSRSRATSGKSGTRRCVICSSSTRSQTPVSCRDRGIRLPSTTSVRWVDARTRLQWVF